METRPGIVVSATAHALVLGWVIFGFVSTPPLAAPTEPLPVEILTPSQFDHLTKGTMKGKELNSGKVEAKKIAVPTPEPKPDLPDAKENVTPPPSPPPPRHEAEPPPKPKVAEKPEPKPAPKVAEAKPVPVPKPPPPKPAAEDAVPARKPPPEKRVDKRQMAALDKLIDKAAAKPKPEPKPEPKKVDHRDKADLAKLIDAVDEPEAKPKPKTRRPPEKQIAKFDPTKIAALIDRRDPGQVAPTAERASTTSSAGIRDGIDGRLSVTARRMIDGQVREQVERCWNPPAGAVGADNLRVRVRFSLNADGSLSGGPSITNTSSAPYFRVAAESASRAVRECAPLHLPSQYYSYWKDVEITFDPRDMMGG